MDLLRPTAGTLEVFGTSPGDGGHRLRSRIGYLPGELSLAGSRTAGQVLTYLARLRGAGTRTIPELAERFGLDLERPIRGLSKGNKQKVGVIQAFMHGPELLVLDEPTSGLDPLLQKEFRALVRESRTRGATVFMSSHVLSEVEEVADRVGVVREGRIVDVDDVRVLRRRAGQSIRFKSASAVPGKAFSGIPGLGNLSVHGDTLTCSLHGEPDALLKVAARYHVTSWSAQERDLEDLFLDFYRTGNDPAAQREAMPQNGSEEHRRD